MLMDADVPAWMPSGTANAKQATAAKPANNCDPPLPPLKANLNMDDIVTETKPDDDNAAKLSPTPMIHPTSQSSL
jgi:hypothetical protein